MCGLRSLLTNNMCPMKLHVRGLKSTSVCWFEWEMFSTGSHIWTLGSQLVELFGKIIEPLGGGALLKRESNWEWTGAVLASFSHSLRPQSGWKCDHPASCSCGHAFLTVTDSLWYHKSRLNPFLFWVSVAMVSYHWRRGIIYTFLTFQLGPMHLFPIHLLAFKSRGLHRPNMHFSLWILAAVYKVMIHITSFTLCSITQNTTSALHTIWYMLQYVWYMLVLH